MRKAKKLLALILSFAMIITMVQIPLVISAEDEAENEVTVYVSAKGSDEAYVDDETDYGDGTAEHPYASIAVAMAAIENNSEATSGRIVISDDVYDDETKGITYTYSDYTKKITICGANNDILLNGNISVRGPLVIENISIAKGINIVTRGIDLTLGDNTKNVGSFTTYVGGAARTIPGETFISKPYYSVDNWGFRTIYIGDNANYTANGDVNVLVSGGYFNAFRLSSGTFNKNVNIVLEDLAKCQSTSKLYVQKTPVVNGAIQLVLNGGLDRKSLLMQTADETDSVKAFKNYTAAKGNWLMYSEANNYGGKLSTTETAGKFIVEGGAIAKAYKITTDDEGNEISRVSEPSAESIDGILDLSGIDNAGEYVVSYSSPHISEDGVLTVYVSTKGDDSSVFGAEDAPFATIAKAMEVIEAETDATSGKIIILEDDNGYAEDGTTELDDGILFTSAAHTKMITLCGIDETIIVYGVERNTYYKINGPLTLDTITLKNLSLHTCGNKLIVGNCIQSGASTISSAPDYTTTSGEDIRIENLKNDVYNSWRSLWVGRYSGTNSNDYYTANGDINVYINSIHTNQTQIRGGVYNGNVNFTINGFGGIKNHAKFGIVNTPVFNGAVQVIINNGINRTSEIDSASFRTLAPADKTWVMYGESADDGSILEMTDTVGVYTVKGNMFANAYKIDVTSETADDGTVTYTENVSVTSVKSKDGILDLSDAPGEYIIKYTYPEAEVNSDSVVYVSATGSNLADGKTADTAFGTFEFAEKWLNLSTAEGEKTIIVVGTVSYSGAAHSEKFNIVGYDADSVLEFSSTLTLAGPYDIDNINVYFTKNSASVYTNGNALHFGSNAVVMGGSNAFYAGPFEDGITTPENIVIDNAGADTWASKLRLGAFNPSLTSAGMNVVINNGNFWQLLLHDNAATYNGDVFITFNNIKLANDFGFANGRNLSTFNGAFQIILNNNLGATLVDDSVRSIEAADGEWFIYGTTGGTLSTTEDIGIFKVTSDLTAKAVNTQTGEVFFSVNGYLSVPEGEYNVSYIDDANLTKTYYVSQNGSDENDGLTEGTAVKTIAKAVELSSDTAKIVVLDTAAYDITSAYTKNITISGGTITGDITLYNDLIIENTIIGATVIDTNGYGLVVGEGVSFANGKPSVITDERLLINSGDFANIRIEGNGVSKLYAYGATIESVVVSTTSTDAIVKVNVEGNADLSVDGQYKTAQIIFNKTTADVTTEAENAWIIGSENSGNSTVDFTDTDGKFTVTTENEKTPVAVSKDGETVYVADEFDYTYDSIDLDETAATKHDAFINYRGGMPNVYKKLQNGEKLNVVYFGGSVTAGAGLPTNADREVDSWRAKIGNWLVNNFPNSNITNIDKSSGESGTYLGVCRLPYIIAENPDLLIIEFGINDYYYKATYDEAAGRFETIVREVKAALPDCDIITLLTTEELFFNSASQGTLHTQAQAHEDVAAYYNIPSLKIGCALTSQIAYEDWDTYFTDIVHPTAAGYQLYYNCIEEFFSNALLHADYDENDTFVMPPVKSTYLFDGGRTATGITEEMFAYSTEQGGTGFTYSDTLGNNNELQGVAIGSAVGDTFYFKFYGTAAAIAFKHKGQEYAPLVSIDGGEDVLPPVAQLANNPIRIAEGLDLGWHTVKLTSNYASTQITGIYYYDETANTLQGEGADETFKKATLTLESGTYNVDYLTDATIDSLVAPEKEGYTFVGWADEDGNIVTELTLGAKLTAVYEEELSEEDKPYDIDDDGKVNATDMSWIMKALLKMADLLDFDVNRDGHSDIRDLVAIKNKLAELGIE